MADSDNVPVKKRRLTENDWKNLAEEIKADYEKRRKNRRQLEKQWKQVDRQIAMKPEAMKKKTGGNPGQKWMPNLELPHQAQSLEILCADARRITFADDRNFFSAHSGPTDAELLKLEDTPLIAGDDFGIKSRMEMRNVDALVEGALIYCHSQYDLRGVMDRLNAEAFKYGTWVAKCIMVNRDKFSSGFRGVTLEKERIPVLVPRSIKNVYLDDSTTAILHQGQMVGPAPIEYRYQLLDDLLLAAKAGSNEPTNENGGWMPERMGDLKGDKHGFVKVLDREGDVIIRRSAGPNIFLPNVIITVVISESGPKVVRYREREFPFRSMIQQAYHDENVDSAYAASPLMKGAPVQNSATSAWNRLVQSVLLNAEPPVQYNPQDAFMQKTSGPVLEPGAKWQALSDIKVHEIGNPAALLQAFVTLLQIYADVVGVTAPRLGAQTKSHQTAFAIDTEQTRGQTRTVDYVRSMMFGGLNDFLSMEYEMLRQTFRKRSIYIPKDNGWSPVSGDILPKLVTFDVHGAAGPTEEREKQAEQLQAINLAMQMDASLIQSGQQPNLDVAGMQLHILESAFKGELDVGKFIAQTEIGAGGLAPELGGAGDPGELEGTQSDALASLGQFAG